MEEKEKVPNPKQSSSSATTTKTAKRNALGKDQRRRRREEKFYQALYQNKDSHIQFVSADLIRQLQNQSSGIPTPSSSSATTTAALKVKKKISFSLVASSPATARRSGESATGTGEDEASACSTNCPRPQSEFEFPPLASPPEKSRGSLTKKSPKSPESKTAAESKDNQDKQQSQSESHEETEPVPSSSKSLPGSWVTVTNKKSPVKRVKAQTQTSTSISSHPQKSPLPAPVPSTTKGRKSKQPMVIDVNALIVTKKKDKDQNETRKMNQGKVGGVTPIKIKENNKLTPGNPLDSSGPGVMHRGKIRSKKKKPSKLKMTILRGRAIRKILLQEQSRQAEENKEAMRIKMEEDVPKTPSINEEETADEEEGPWKSLIKRLTFTEEEEMENETAPEIVIKTEEPKEEVESPCLKQEGIASVKEIDFGVNKFLKLLDDFSTMKMERAIPLEIEQSVKSLMHNRKFRDYCDMHTSKELHGLVYTLLAELHRFQDKLYHTDPIKFKTKRRYVLGLKESHTYLNLNKVQLLIIAPDIEKNAEPGGLDEKLNQILTACRGRNVPYVFSSTKYNLGKPLRIKTPVSIISILDKQSCEETFRAILEEANRLREKYQKDLMEKLEQFMLQSGDSPASL